MYLERFGEKSAVQSETGCLCGGVTGRGLGLESVVVGVGWLESQGIIGAGRMVVVSVMESTDLAYPCAALAG